MRTCTESIFFFFFDSKDIFISERGSRLNVKKVLIVITDGKSHDRDKLQNAASLADQKKIVRFSIGVNYLFKYNNLHSLLNCLKVWDHLPQKLAFIQVVNAF